MRVRNFTPYAHLLYANEDAQGRLFDVLIVKQSFELSDSFELLPAIEQEPLNFADTCYEDFNTSSLKYPSDLVPFKPVTDIIVTANSYAPDGAALPHWDCGIQVSGAAGFEKTLRVTGPRQWDCKRNGKHVLTEPEPATMVPLRYEFAFGGEVARDEDDIDTDERNPLGCGLLMDGAQGRVPAPQIEAANQPISDPSRRYTPEGIGPIPPAWLPRRPLGGTYDENWVENIWPHWAPDYDFAFHNSAGPGMKANGYLNGDETIYFRHLRTDSADFSITLSGDKMLANLVDNKRQRTTIALNLDTVYIDLLPEDPEDCLIALTWRLAFLDHDVDWIEIDSTIVANPIRLWGTQGATVAAPHPSELFSDKDPAYVQ